MAIDIHKEAEAGTLDHEHITWISCLCPERVNDADGKVPSPISSLW